VKALVKIGKPVVPPLVKVLGDPRNDVRAAAAEALRHILAADPASAPNCHKKAFWEQRIAQLKPGMTLDEALEVLLPDLSPAERRKAMQMMCSSGGSSTSVYRLDDYWTIVIYSLDERRSPSPDRAGLQHDSNAPFEQGRLGPTPPVLERKARQVWVKPPAAYTGPWTTWHVNGQKAHEMQYRNGQYNGVFAAFFDDGSKCYQQHYTMGVCEGTDTGWHRSGKKAYEGQYDHGKQVGTWRWWKEDGQIASTREYEAGKQVGKTDN
jgi:hypothetical protein